LIDTPGYAAFAADAKAVWPSPKRRCFFVEAVAGVQVITERVFPVLQGVSGPPRVRDQQARS
jgi:translation elongation factor EF-G